jgi:hypothetical protein
MAFDTVAERDCKRGSGTDHAARHEADAASQTDMDVSGAPAGGKDLAVEWQHKRPLESELSISHLSRSTGAGGSDCTIECRSRDSAGGNTGSSGMRVIQRGSQQSASAPGCAGANLYKIRWQEGQR